MRLFHLLTAFALLGLVLGCDGGAPPKKTAKKESTAGGETVKASSKSSGDTNDKKPAGPEKSEKKGPPDKKPDGKGGKGLPPLPESGSAKSGSSGSSLPDFHVNVNSGGGNTGSSSGGSPGGSFFGGGTNLSAMECMDKILVQIKDSLNESPTVVVWLIDNTKPAEGILNQVKNRLNAFYTNEFPGGGKLTSAVLTFGGKAAYVIEDPIVQGPAVMDAINKITTDGSGKAFPFAAVKMAGERYLPLKKGNREMVFVIITAQAGEDDNLADEASRIPKKNVIPVYVIGVPAPLGRMYGTTGVPDASAVRVGPDSRYPEYVALGLPNGVSEFDLIDSGYGPWGLEYLSRATSGKFLSVRSGAGIDGNWPNGRVPRLNPDMMTKYAPEYTSDAEYQKLMENGARKALIEAARLPPVSVNVTFGITSFGKGSEVEMKRRLDDAQKAPARLEPLYRDMYEALKKGEGDRDGLTSPRLQAEYDLAMGRVLAIKARVEGYNAMLALLKQGKTFKSPTSSGWQLMMSDTTEAGSAVAGLIDGSKKYLQRVIKDHPGTHWAKIAQAELQQPLGWVWKEQ